jgi:hypothetical protein
MTLKMEVEQGCHDERMVDAAVLNHAHHFGDRHRPCQDILRVVELNRMAEGAVLN